MSTQEANDLRAALQRLCHQLHIGGDWRNEYHAAKALLARPDTQSDEPAAAEKAREPTHEGFPVDTRVRDILTDRVGVIESYHCRFEVQWEDGTSTMDVHGGQLDHCGSFPSPPAATGEAR